MKERLTDNILFIVEWLLNFIKQNYHRHNYDVRLARISLTLSLHVSLSFIAFGRSSGLHPVSSHSCCMNVRAGHPAFDWPYAGVHRSTSLTISFFQAAVVSILLYGCTTWTLTKRLEKKLDGNYTRMLRAILNRSWQQHLNRRQLYGHLPPITKTIQARRTRHAGHCWRSKQNYINMTFYLYGIKIILNIMNRISVNADCIICNIYNILLLYHHHHHWEVPVV